MDPKLWGSGAWKLIFVRIYYTISIMNAENYMYEIEKLKKILYMICSTLPCSTCSDHAKQNISANSIMSNININDILHFFIHLYNSQHSYNIIDLSQIQTYKVFI